MLPTPKITAALHVLGLTFAQFETMSNEQLHRFRRELIKSCHPDLPANQGKRTDLGAINAAYDYLRSLGSTSFNSAVRSTIAPPWQPDKRTTNNTIRVESYRDVNYIKKRCWELSGHSDSVYTLDAFGKTAFEGRTLVYGSPEIYDEMAQAMLVWNANGGKLTAIRYPEREIVSVPAHQMYFQNSRPFLSADPRVPGEQQRTQQQAFDDVLDLEDFTGKRLIDTRLAPRITIREENSIAALEVMSRFAVDPKWLIYLPPTMSPCETSDQTTLLEHPQEAFGYYRSEGVSEVICEQKHMGSRAVVVLCKDEAVSQRRFGVVTPRLGCVYTRTGRRFFTEDALEKTFLQRVRDAAEASGLWAELNSDWMCLDCELMPWSAKAQELLRLQYAPVGAAARATLSAEQEILAQARRRVSGLDELAERTASRLRAIDSYIHEYRQYCWPVASLDDLKLAPFHLLASEGAVHTTQRHTWHMEMISKLCAADNRLLLATPFQLVNLSDPASCEAATVWWTDMTAAGREGMVVKPLDFIAQGRRRAVQPAIKVRGPEYLRIIYGPEYRLPGNLDRLRARNVGTKRSLAGREFALGIEALARFVSREPLRRIHECVFGILALESEPVDPRL